MLSERGQKIRIDVDFGALSFVLWCSAAVCHEFFNFCQIGQIVVVVGITLNESMNIYYVFITWFKQRHTNLLECFFSQMLIHCQVMTVINIYYCEWSYFDIWAFNIKKLESVKNRKLNFYIDFYLSDKYLTLTMVRNELFL